MKRILSCEYDAGNNVKSAFRALSREKLCNIYLGDKDQELFPSELKENHNLAASLVIALGEKTLSSWIAEDSDINLRRNTLDLIDYALTLGDAALVGEMISLDLSNTLLAKEIRSLIGSSHMGTVTEISDYPVY